MPSSLSTSLKPWGTTEISGKPPSPLAPPLPKKKHGWRWWRIIWTLFFFFHSVWSCRDVLFIPFYISGTIIGLYTVSSVFSMLLFVSSHFKAWFSPQSASEASLTQPFLFHRNVRKNAKKYIYYGKALCAIQLATSTLHPIELTYICMTAKLHFIVDLTLTDRRDCICIRHVPNALDVHSKTGVPTSRLN